jgi:transposase
MIFPSNRVRILVATGPVDFRKGHDGLIAMVQSVLRKDPFTGTVFVFRAKRADRLKLLYWDGSGLVTADKRLEDTTFAWPRWPAVVCLQTMRGGDQGRNDGAESRAVRGVVCWAGPPPRRCKYRLPVNGRKVKALEARPPPAAE